MKYLLSSFLLLTLFSFSSSAQFKVPSLTGPVVDQAKVISYDDEKRADAIIRSLYESGKGQLVLVTIPSLEGQSIEEVGIQIADNWKLGTAKEDNGIILIAAIEDRKVRIEVGQGLEGTIPDAKASRIIHDIIIPSIRSTSLSNGLLTGVIAIAQELDPSFATPSQSNEFSRRERRGTPIGVGGYIILILFIIAFKFLLFGAGVRSGTRRSNSYTGWGSGGGGYGGGGGFGGFGGGGGGFSGGGASGGW